MYYEVGVSGTVPHRQGEGADLSCGVAAEGTDQSTPAAAAWAASAWAASAAPLRADRRRAGRERCKRPRAEVLSSWSRFPNGATREAADSDSDPRAQGDQTESLTAVHR